MWLGMRETQGFGVRVSPAGAKTFIVKYRLPSGRVGWKTIGRVGKISLEKARKRAQDDIGIVARGLDPLREIDVARGVQSVAAVAEKFLSDYVEARRGTATARLYRLAVDSYITPRLGTIPIGDPRRLMPCRFTTAYAPPKSWPTARWLCSRSSWPGA